MMGKKRTKANESSVISDIQSLNMQARLLSGLAAYSDSSIPTRRTRREVLNAYSSNSNVRGIFGGIILLALPIIFALTADPSKISNASGFSLIITTTISVILTGFGMYLIIRCARSLTREIRFGSRLGTGWRVQKMISERTDFNISLLAATTSFEESTESQIMRLRNLGLSSKSESLNKAYRALEQRYHLSDLSQKVHFRNHASSENQP